MAVKDTIELGLSDGINWKDISDKPIGNESNQINSNGVIEHINANTIRSGTITGTKIQTNPSGARVVIGGVGEDANDIMLVDDTTGGTGDVLGNTASIDFIRNDDYTQKFVMQKRSGINNADENVFEMFYDTDANNSADNWLFIGRKGNVDPYGSLGLASGDLKLDRLWLCGNDFVALQVKNSNNIMLDGIALYSSYAFDDASPGYVSAGASRVDLSYNQADTPANISFPNLTGGGGIMFHRADPVGLTQNIMAAFDKDGLRLWSNDGSQSGYLTVNNTDGKLEWNGTAIS